MGLPPSERHTLVADAAFDGGDLDCGNGLLLLIRRHIDPLPQGGLLEVRSTEVSVDEVLPAWCRLTRNALVSWTRHGKQRSFLICKGALAARQAPPAVAAAEQPATAAAASLGRAWRAGAATPAAGARRHRDRQLAAPALADRGHAPPC